MRMDELEAVCQQAASDLVAREGAPVPTAVVLPLASATRVVTMPDFPDDPATRTRLLSRFADDEMRTANAPCYGFIAAATAPAVSAETSEAGEHDSVEVVMVCYGARGNHPWVTAAAVDDGQLGPFAEAEPVDPGAFEFLAPLQQAAEAATAPDVTGGLAGES
jgi:hypothetical protein